MIAGRTIVEGRLPALISVLALLVGCARSEAAVDPQPLPKSSATAAAVASVSPSAASGRIEVAPSLERSCREICGKSTQLGCQNASKCMPNCLAMGSVTPCTKEMLGFYQCLASQPAKNWECAPDGVAAIKAGFCDAEQAQTVACMKSSMKPR
jgi:hypothetical protein